MLQSWTSHTRKLRNDFKTDNRNKGASYYDLNDDWVLVESSLAKQYGIRIRHIAEDMSWDEFSTLVSGIMPDTPLGQIINIRAETDPEVIKNFNTQQRKIYNDWRNKQARQMLDDTRSLDEQMKQIEKMFASMFGKRGG